MCAGRDLSLRSRFGKKPALNGLTPDIPCVQAAGDACIGCSLDDGPAVRKQGEFVGIAPELQDKVVMFDCPVGLKAGAHFDEIHWPVALMNLDRIPAAHSDLRTPSPGQMDKVMLLAGLASRTRLGRRNLSLLIAPDIKGEQRPA